MSVGDAGIDIRAGAALPPVRPGDILLGKYRVERVLGEGGMGMVVAVRHVERGDPFAVKVLSPRALAGPHAVERFLREARVVARLRGEHVAKVHELGPLENGSPCMVMDLLVGSDLQEIVNTRGALTIEQAIDYVLQACEGVAEAHGLDIIHRDIKPANLFLTWLSDGAPCVKVLDFGIAKHVGAEAAQSTELTRTGMIFGSPAYMSPEQMKHTKNADARSDIWSMGVVLYQLLTGVLPFYSEAVLDLAVKVAVDRPVPPSERRPEISPALDAVVLRCLEKNPDRRFQTVRDLMHHLRSARRDNDAATLFVLGKKKHGGGAAETVAAPSASAASTLPLGLGRALATTARAADSEAATPRIQKPSDPGQGALEDPIALAETDAVPALPAPGARPSPPPPDRGDERTILSPGAPPPAQPDEVPPETPTQMADRKVLPPTFGGEAAGIVDRWVGGRGASGAALPPTFSLPESAPALPLPPLPAQPPRPFVVPAAPTLRAGESPKRALPSILDTLPGEETRTDAPPPIHDFGAFYPAQRVSSNPAEAGRPSVAPVPPAGARLPATSWRTPAVLAAAVSLLLLVVISLVSLALRGGTSTPPEGKGAPPPATSLAPTPPTQPAPATTSAFDPGQSGILVPSASSAASAEPSTPSPSASAAASGQPITGTKTRTPTPTTSTKPRFDACFTTADCRKGKKCIQGWCQ